MFRKTISESVADLFVGQPRLLGMPKYLSYSEIKLYEGFDEEGHRIIIFSVKLDLVQVDFTATSLETGRGRHS